MTRPPPAPLTNLLSSRQPSSCRYADRAEVLVMAVKVGINGFGRIGRNIMRAALGDQGIDFVAVNDLTNTATLAHLLKYDSILGNLHADVKASGEGISVDGEEFKVLSL